MYAINEIISSFNFETKTGIPLGNLSSQIFANIYLNEFDRYIRHVLKPNAYLRYGDDFIIIMDNRENLELVKKKAINFLSNDLKLEVKENGIVLKVKQGLKFLGMIITPNQIVLSKRNVKRIFYRLNLKNISSYYGLIDQFVTKDLKRRFKWKTLELLNKDKPSPTTDNTDYHSDC